MLQVEHRKIKYSKSEVLTQKYIYHINHCGELGNKNAAVSESQIPLTPFDFKFLLIKFRQSSQWTGHRKCQFNEVRRAVSYDRSEHLLSCHVTTVHATLIPEQEIACPVV
jgi:hypothetical protein